MTRKLDRILVVDGSEVTRTIIARTLNTEIPDTEIVTCGTAAEACQWLECSRYDLITTSLMLPDRDGLELVRHVRASQQHHYTPTIVVSGDADVRLLREGFAAGVTDYFDKLLGYQAFAEFIRDFMQRNSGLVGRILYVEDSRVAASVLLRLMEHHGLQVVHVSEAEEAITLLRETAAGGPRSDQGFDMVITDFHLKGHLTGGDLLHAIRTRFRYSQQEMPVLVLTASETDASQVEVFHAGANDFVTKPVIEEVLLARIRSLILIKQQFAALKRQTESMHQQAITDSLTGLYNRRYLLDHGDAFVARRTNHPIAALLVDIDHFKKINDRMGHICGDRVLEALGKLLLDHLPDGAMGVRFGGEEFALLIPRYSIDDASSYAEQLRCEVVQLNPCDISMTISIGITTSLNNADVTLPGLLSLADKALYDAKGRGRNQVCA